MACCSACTHFTPYAGTCGGRCVHRHCDTLSYCSQCDDFDHKPKEAVHEPIQA